MTITKTRQVGDPGNSMSLFADQSKQKRQKCAMVEKAIDCPLYCITPLRDSRQKQTPRHPGHKGKDINLAIMSHLKDPEASQLLTTG